MLVSIIGKALTDEALKAKLGELHLPNIDSASTKATASTATVDSASTKSSTSTEEDGFDGECPMQRVWQNNHTESPLANDEGDKSSSSPQRKMARVENNMMPVAVDQAASGPTSATNNSNLCPVATAGALAALGPTSATNNSNQLQPVAPAVYAPATNAAMYALAMNAPAMNAPTMSTPAMSTPAVMYTPAMYNTMNVQYQGMTTMNPTDGPTHVPNAVPTTTLVQASVETSAETHKVKESSVATGEKVCTCLEEIKGAIFVTLYCVAKCLTIDVLSNA